MNKQILGLRLYLKNNKGNYTEITIITNDMNSEKLVFEADSVSIYPLNENYYFVKYQDVENDYKNNIQF